MLEIFLKTLPFFALIGVGYGAGRTQFFTEEATSYLTKFVFYFALSAMLFRFSANLPFSDIFNGRLILAYLWGTAAVYGIATAVAFLRGLDVPTAAIEATVRSRPAPSTDSPRISVLISWCWARKGTLIIHSSALSGMTMRARVGTIGMSRRPCR